MGKVKQQDDKRVVYLFGAGATQAEISLVSSSIRILAGDVRDGIFQTISTHPSHKKKFPGLINELSNNSADVEHLITLYESSGNRKHSGIASLLKKLYREEIQIRIKGLGADFTPKLYPALIDMHEIAGSGEKLAGLLTLNYEDLLDQGAQSVKTTIDYSIRMTTKHKLFKPKQGAGFPVLKLHGSFNWKNTYPVTLVNDDKIRNYKDVLWIPPGVLKRRETYPFSILWGKAMEILDCDILRVIGCSLNRNDWQLVSLLYRTQQLNTQNKKYRLELINDPLSCENIQNNYSYLTCIKISEIRELREMMARDMNVPQDGVTDEAMDEWLGRKNIFDLWLRSKGESLQARNVSIKTSKQIFANYMNEKTSHENNT